jgi:methionyl-tRNA formyltransferase
MRLVFFGSGSFGLPTLQRLVRVHHVALVVTQPDRPAGRHRRLTPTPIGEFAEQQGLTVSKPERANAPEVIATIRSAAAGAFVVIAYGHKLGPGLLQHTFAINLHASLLPKYRGAAPINWAMINGERETGVSVITLAQVMDAGEILASAATPIDPCETAGELHDRLALMGPDLINKTLSEHRSGTLRPRAQDARLATHAPKLNKADGTVRFDQSAQQVRQRIHGLTPWPGCTIQLSGRPLRVLRVAEIEMEGGEPPGQLRADLTIACQPGSIRLLEVQPPGGRIMSFEEYCRGHRLEAGAMCETNA